MRRIYLLGYPLGHSISPAMQNAALRSCGLAWQYLKLALPVEQMKVMMEALHAPECAGANVTIPHKQTVIPLLDELSDTARAIGAVNTIVKRDNRLIGENSDAPGFLQALQLRQVQLRGARVYLLGAGGAAAAVAFGLAGAGAQHIVIVNRTAARAADLAGRLRTAFPELEIEVNRWDSFAEANIVVNATAAGMAPHAADSPLPQDRPVPRAAVVYDLVYNPPETRLLREAAQRGATCIGGLEMLVYQGALAFQLWTGHPAPVDVMRAAAEEALTLA